MLNNCPVNTEEKTKSRKGLLKSAKSSLSLFKDFSSILLSKEYKRYMELNKELKSLNKNEVTYLEKEIEFYQYDKALVSKVSQSVEKNGCQFIKDLSLALDCLEVTATLPPFVKNIIPFIDKKMNQLIVNTIKDFEQDALSVADDMIKRAETDLLNSTIETAKDPETELEKLKKLVDHLDMNVQDAVWENDTFREYFYALNLKYFSTDEDFECFDKKFFEYTVKKNNTLLRGVSFVPFDETTEIYPKFNAVFEEIERHTSSDLIEAPDPIHSPLLSNLLKDMYYSLDKTHSHYFPISNPETLQLKVQLKLFGLFDDHTTVDDDYLKVDTTILPKFDLTPLFPEKETDIMIFCDVTNDELYATLADTRTER
ncbi:MAG: hypothetical protein ACRDCC_08380 [Culicoidibacterales bacterium]